MLATERLARHMPWVDVFVESTGEMFKGCKVFVTESRVIVWSVLVDNTPEIVAEYQLTAQVQPNRSNFPRLSVQTDVGAVHMNRSAGCDCHSPLRHIATPASWRL